MFSRVLLVCLALFAVAYAQPLPGDEVEAFDVSRSGLARPFVLPEPDDNRQQRTLVFLLPILFPKEFYLT